MFCYRAEYVYAVALLDECFASLWRSRMGRFNGWSPVEFGQWGFLPRAMGMAYDAVEQYSA